MQGKECLGNLTIRIVYHDLSLVRLLHFLDLRNYSKEWQTDHRLDIKSTFHSVIDKRDEERKCQSKA